jgi:3',5'-nucleoside bisphosphate phosphatase
VRSYVADLHIHTCLSPCGNLRMSPRTIVATARDRGLDLIAITDHNTCAMADTVATVAREEGLSFLYGIEVQTREDVHVLGYFDDAPACTAFSEAIYERLPDRPNEPHHFGDQVVVDADETILRFEPRLLLNAIELSLEEVIEAIRAHDGLAVPAHVDRQTFGLLGQLGLPPQDLTFPIIEVIGDEVPDGFPGAAILRSSDAHEPEAIGRRTSVLRLQAVTVEEMRLAAAGTGGRFIESDLSPRRHP